MERFDVACLRYHPHNDPAHRLRTPTPHIREDPHFIGLRGCAELRPNFARRSGSPRPIASSKARGCRPSRTLLDAVGRIDPLRQAMFSAARPTTEPTNQPRTNHVRIASRLPLTERPRTSAKSPLFHMSGSLSCGVLWPRMAPAGCSMHRWCHGHPGLPLRTLHNTRPTAHPTEPDWWSESASLSGQQCQGSAMAVRVSWPS